MQHNGWDHALKVTGGGAGLVGHAGAVLLRKAADQAGLTGQLSAALRKAGTSPVLDRGIVLVSMAVGIALGATSMSDIAVLAHLAPVLGDAPSGPTVRRALDLAGHAAMLDRIARARARARAHVWTLIEQAPAGFPWLGIAGKTLAGWLVIDMDATLVTARSDKQGAAPTWKKGYGFHPLGAWAANTRECLAMLLRPGNAGSNTFTDHRDVLAAAICQVPARFRRKILVRVDGAGASHELVKHLLSMSSPRRTVLFTCGWMITAADEDAIRQVPAAAAFSRGPRRERRSVHRVCAAQRLVLRTLPCATGVVQACYRRVVVVVWLSCVMSSRLAARAAFRSWSRSPSWSRRSAACCSRWVIFWFRASMSAGAPSPDSRHACSPSASESRFSSCRVRAWSRSARSWAASRSVCRDARVTAGPGPARPMAGRLRGRGSSPAGHGAGKGKCGRPRRHARFRRR